MLVTHYLGHIVCQTHIPLYSNMQCQDSWNIFSNILRVLKEVNPLDAYLDIPSVVNRITLFSLQSLFCTLQVDQIVAVDE